MEAGNDARHDRKDIRTSRPLRTLTFVGQPATLEGTYVY